MHPAIINAEITLAGRTQTDIAKSLGIHASRVNHVVHRRSSSREIRKAIAKIINKPIDEVWPDEKHRCVNGRILEPLARTA